MLYDPKGNPIIPEDQYEREAQQMKATAAIKGALERFKVDAPDHPAEVVYVGSHIWEVFCREVDMAHKIHKQPSPIPLKPNEPQALDVPSLGVTVALDGSLGPTKLRPAGTRRGLKMGRA
uniref:Uncharacterized protein n=2 Tax=viral metagenome TaxID=1070528 RepID=A0A6H1ZE04_9ZZZZ